MDPDGRTIHDQILTMLDEIGRLLDEIRNEVTALRDDGGNDDGRT